MSETIDQPARDMIAAVRAQIDRHEAICLRDREQAMQWRRDARKILDDIRQEIRDAHEDVERRFGDQQAINSSLQLRVMAPDKLLLRFSMAANMALLSAVVWAMLKLLKLV